MQKNVALRIRSARQAARLTQADLAARLRVSRSAVAQWENASGSTPATAHFAGLAQVLGCTFEWLATGRGRRMARGREAEAGVAGASADLAGTGADRRVETGANVPVGRAIGAGARHPGLAGEDVSSFSDDGAIPAVALRYFARDDEEERLFGAFRLLDAFDRNAVLLLTETLSSRPKRAWRRNPEL